MFGKLYLGNGHIELLELSSFNFHLITFGLWHDVHKQYAGHNVFKVLRWKYDGIWDKQANHKPGPINLQLDNQRNIALEHAQPNVLRIVGLDCNRFGLFVHGNVYQGKEVSKE